MGYKRLEYFTREDCWNWRKEVVVNSLFLHDYENTFGIKKDYAIAYFNGYYDFMWELAEEDKMENPQHYSEGELTHDEVMQYFDNADTLWERHWCHEFDEDDETLYDWADEVEEDRTTEMPWDYGKHFE